MMADIQNPINSPPEKPLNKIYLIDTETTGRDPKEPIEVAWALFTPAADPVVHVQRFRPAGEITLGAAVVHGILPGELADCPPSSEASSFIPLESGDFIVAHNVDFDYEVIGSPDGVRCIDTLGISQYLWPEIDCHKQLAVLYHLFGFEPWLRDLAKNAHSAAADVRMLHLLASQIVERQNLQSGGQLYNFSVLARTHPKQIAWGKHRGKFLFSTEESEAVPSDYLQYMLTQDLNGYTRQAFVNALAWREQASIADD